MTTGDAPSGGAEDGALCIRIESPTSDSRTFNVANELTARDTDSNASPNYSPAYDAVRRIEVKAMTGTMMDRPVGMSRAQFECATEHGRNFWLYVVERADDPERRRIVRIQGPAERSRSFTFDRGWAALDSPAPRPSTAATEDV